MSNNTEEPSFPFRKALIVWGPLTIIATTLYIVILVQLTRYRNTTPYNSSFFMLWRNLGIADIFFMFYSWVSFRLPYCEFWEEEILTAVPAPLDQITTGDDCILITYFFHVVTIGVLLMMLHRFSVLHWPVKHKMVTKLEISK
jgi:hypothetical protein